MWNLDNLEENNDFTHPWLVLDKTHLKQRNTLTHTENKQTKQGKWKISILAKVQYYHYVKKCYFTINMQNSWLRL